MKSKDIGTRYETSVVRYLRDNGFVNAERRALAGIHDLGDITGTPGLAWECKSGQTAYTASDGLIGSWLVDTERERKAANADLGILVVDRGSYGALRVGETWAIVRASALIDRDSFPNLVHSMGDRPVRMHLTSVVLMLRALGYGDPLETPAMRVLNTTRLSA